MGAREHSTGEVNLCDLLRFVRELLEQTFRLLGLAVDVMVHQEPERAPDLNVGVDGRIADVITADFWGFIAMSPTPAA